MCLGKDGDRMANGQQVSANSSQVEGRWYLAITAVDSAYNSCTTTYQCMDIGSISHCTLQYCVLQNCLQDILLKAAHTILTWVLGTSEDRVGGSTICSKPCGGRVYKVSRSWAAVLAKHCSVQVTHVQKNGVEEKGTINCIYYRTII